MNRFCSSALLLIILTFYVSGQSDPKAVKILDKFSATASSAPSVSMKFLIITVDQAEKSIDTTAGSVILSKDSYRLNLPDNIIWFNGETSWSYLPAEQEVTITKPDKKDNSFQNRPSAVFTMYRKGFKSRLIEEKADAWVVDLYPEDIENDLIRVRLTISKQNNILRTFEYKRRDGVIITLVIQEFDLRQVPDAGTFIFPADKYKGADVIDMR